MLASSKALAQMSWPSQEYFRNCGRINQSKRRKRTLLLQATPKAGPSGEQKPMPLKPSRRLSESAPIKRSKCVKWKRRAAGESGWPDEGANRLEIGEMGEQER